VIVVDKVSKSFKGAEKSVTKAVNQVSLTAKPGRIHAVLGPNGSGKTTLLRMLVGLLKPDEGRIHIERSAIPSELQRVKAKLGFLTGSAALHKKLTVITEKTENRANGGANGDEWVLR